MVAHNYYLNTWEAEIDRSLCAPGCHGYIVRPIFKNKNQNKIYSLVFVWNILQIFARSIWSMMLFNNSISLFWFNLNYLSIGKSGVLKSPTIIVARSICDFVCVMFLLWTWVALCLCINGYNLYCIYMCYCEFFL